MAWRLLLPFALFSAVSGHECPSGAVRSRNSDRCFHLMPLKSDFAVAEQSCRLFGGNLVSIRNEDDQEAVRLMVRNQDSLSQVWIGGINLLTDVWKWSDGEPFRFSNIDPTDSKVWGCLSLTAVDRKWLPTECCTQQAFVCETAIPEPISCPQVTCPAQLPCPTEAPAPTQPVTTKASPTTPPTTPAPNTEVPSTTKASSGSTCNALPACTAPPCKWTCDPRWSFNSNTRFCYRAMSDVLSWSKAENACVLGGGHLASVHSLAENKFVASLAANSARKRVWLGGRYSVKQNKWTWTDGCPFDYAVWAPNEPNSPGVENCLEILMDWRNRNWNDILCKSKRIPVCKKPASLQK